MSTRDYMGRGFAYPVATDQTTGDFKTASETENIRNSVRMFLSTRMGERILFEGYGMPTILFENIGPGTADALRNHAFKGLAKYEPRIAVRRVDIEKTQAASGLVGIRMYVHYTIRATGGADNTVVEI